MRDDLRARVAYVAARLITRADAQEISDHSRTLVLRIEGLVSDDTIDVYDFNRSCRLSGERTDEGFTLYDHNDDAYVDLNLDGDEFEGFDYATGTRYTGEVRAEGIRIFDYGEFTDFEYSLKRPN